MLNVFPTADEIVAKEQSWSTKLKGNFNESLDLWTQ